MKFGLLFRAQDPPAGEHLTRRWQEILRQGSSRRRSASTGSSSPSTT